MGAPFPSRKPWESRNQAETGLQAAGRGLPWRTLSGERGQGTLLHACTGGLGEMEGSLCKLLGGPWTSLSFRLGSRSPASCFRTTASRLCFEKPSEGCTTRASEIQPALARPQLSLGLAVASIPLCPHPGGTWTCYSTFASTKRNKQPKAISVTQAPAGYQEARVTPAQRAAES